MLILLCLAYSYVICINRYDWFNTTDNLIIADETISELNTYVGGVYRKFTHSFKSVFLSLTRFKLLEQAASVVTNNDQDCYTGETGCFSVYGFEYEPGFDNAYISWIANNKLAWTAMEAGFAADSRVNISARPISQEPMVRDHYFRT